MSYPPLLSSLTTVRLNPDNGKCQTLPLLRFDNQFSRNFHLAWLGFFVAFLSWFAFSPLIPGVIKADMALSAEEIGNSNIISLCATLLVRMIVGPCIDRYGPRRTMSALLILGAIPSGLAGTITTAHGLYIVRFFIGILGGTFVTCQAWTTAFFDKGVVGRANALAGGWGNSGGGFTFIIMIALYNALTLQRHLTPHVAWRAAFALVPVPVLIFVAALTLVFGTDCPAGKWEERFRLFGDEASRGDEEGGGGLPSDGDVLDDQKSKEQKDRSCVTVVEPVPANDSTLDRAVNRPLTLTATLDLLLSPLTWLPSLAYMTTFGFELAIDANLANILFGLYKSKGWGQTKAGYIASTYGLLNIVTRPLGGYLGDLAYLRFGVRGKKHLMLVLGALQGAMSLAIGFYVDGRSNPSVTVLIVLMIITAFLNEAANGANFSLVPHCHPNYNGFMSGIVGAMGNLGGVFIAMIFRFQPAPAGRAFWVTGVLCISVNLLLSGISVPSK